eukprot:361038-Chlamydomonas_euryale.AAC.2
MGNAHACWCILRSPWVRRLTGSSAWRSSQVESSPGPHCKQCTARISLCKRSFCPGRHPGASWRILAHPGVKRTIP